MSREGQSYRLPRGTHDILPEESGKWQFIEGRFRELCRRYGYGEIRTPIFEDAELFARTVGRTSDIVSKEMYTFQDRGGRLLALRPEGTAPVIRAFIEHSLHAAGAVQKLYYIAPIFRYDRPQKGRYRQHHQLGVEAIGAPGPDIDAEVIALCIHLLDDVGVQDRKLELNSIGCPQCRPKYREALREALSGLVESLCPDCQARFEQNPLRMFDCKNEKCQEQMRGAPVAVDHLCQECREHFDDLSELLTELDVPFEVNPRIVRGLDYYTRTAFEVTTSSLGAQSALAGGGRYDGLSEELGGPPAPGIGFGCGIERLLLAAGDEVEKKAEESGEGLSGIYIAVLTAQSRKLAAKLLAQLRHEGFAAHTDYQERSLKAQMKEADRLNCAFAALIVERELAEGQLTLRNMKTGEQVSVAPEGIARLLREASPPAGAPAK
jgi:histidyl-tRNA synthetase